MSLTRSLTTLTSVLRSAWRRKQPLVQIPQHSVKLYEQTPPAWARWALVLVSVDVMVATSAVDIIWNAWTMPDPHLENSKATDARPMAVGDKTTPNKLSMLQIIPPGHVLVPAWKRALSGSLFIISGIIVAASVLAARSRIVRSVSYVRHLAGPPPPPGVVPSSVIYVQTASHPVRLGNVHAVKDCWLAPSNENQLMLEVKDQGKWVLDMRGAKIANKLAPEDKTLARSTMLKTWKAVEGSTQRFS